MPWNYRVLRKSLDESEYSYHIIEVYYDNDFNIKFHSGQQEPYGESIEWISDDLHKMGLALNRPVLEEIDGELVEVE